MPHSPRGPAACIHPRGHLPDRVRCALGNAAFARQLRRVDSSLEDDSDRRRHPRRRMGSTGPLPWHRCFFSSRVQTCRPADPQRQQGRHRRRLHCSNRRATRRWCVQDLTPGRRCAVPPGMPIAPQGPGLTLRTGCRSRRRGRASHCARRWSDWFRAGHGRPRIAAWVWS
jgi:hypothetical protein